MEIISLYSPDIFVIREEINFKQFLEQHDSTAVLFIITPAVQKYVSFSSKQGTLTSGYSLIKEDLDKKILELQNNKKMIR